MKKNRRIVITGGHHTCALAIARGLKKEGYEIIWFGHKHTMRGEPSISAEYKEVTKEGFDFVNLKTGKFYKNYHPLEQIRTIFGFLQAFYHLIRLRPVLIVSFGGYLAVPVVLIGWFLRIPSVAHEQTTSVGLANRIISSFVNRIFITWPSSKKFFPSKKTELIGLPLRKSILQARKRRFFNNQLPVIFITGGKQGAHMINKIIEQILPDLLENFNLIHQAGGIVKTGDLKRLKEKKELLPSYLKERYYLKDYFFGKEQGEAFKAADLVISRAGANTVYELAVLGKPAILIPISWSVNNEQTKNAEILQKYGLAEILPENQLSGERLLTTTQKFFLAQKDYLKAKTRVQKLIYQDAVDKLIAYCLKIAK